MTIDDVQLANPVKAVEDLVAFAIMKAGFMRKENYGYPTKVSWTRSSRTDKGVHSVATVVSLKMHCRDESWQDDPEGLEYAAAINKCVLGHSHTRVAFDADDTPWKKTASPASRIDAAHLFVLPLAGDCATLRRNRFAVASVPTKQACRR